MLQTGTMPLDEQSLNMHFAGPFQYRQAWDQVPDGRRIDASALIGLINRVPLDHLTCG